MNMQQMMMQAQKMQRELNKAQAELAEKEFTVSKNGIVTVVVKGDKTVTKIDINPEALNAEDKEMIEDTLALAINEAIAQIEAANDEIQQKITGRAGGFGF